MARVGSMTGAGGGEQLMQSLQMASQAWATFDFQGKRNNLDKTAATTKEQKEQSLTARKVLAEATKQFKRSVKSMEQASSALKDSPSPDSISSSVNAMEGLAKECRQMIKSYQEEIDNLTRRCKASETAFSSVNQALAEVPDPVSLLATAMEQIHSQHTQMAQLLRTVEETNREMSNMESNFSHQSERYKKEISQARDSAPSGLAREEKEELVQLRREVAEYEVEFKSLKNQDITIRKLEAKIAELEDGAKETLAKELERAQQDLAETEGRRAAEALEREAAMERRAQGLELQLKAERAGREATQAHLLEADEGAGEREAAWEAQRKILLDDAERLRETLHEATRERDELRLRVAALEDDGRQTGQTPPPSGGMAMADMILERKAYEAEVSELSHTANSLREELRLKEGSMNEERRELLTTIGVLEKDKAALALEVSTLATQLASAPSQSYVESMRRELRILKRLEYNADDVDADPDPEMTGGVDEEEQDFEAVLVAKLRRVESELVRERNQRVDVSRECDQLKRQVVDAERGRAESEKLIASLEADLEKAITVPPSPSFQKKMANSSLDGENPAILQNILDPEKGDNEPKLTASATEKANDDHSVATIIMAQRDRLRARCEAMEAERDSFKRELQAQVQATESLKVDNTKLYEKVRYLQNYTGGPNRGGAYNRKGLGDRDLDLEALEQRYEASVDPFRQFSRAERQRKMKEMSPMERIVFMVAKTVLGSKEMRTALFFYVCLMHLLVFFSTNSGSQSCDDTDHHEMLSNLPPDQHSKMAEAVLSTASPGN